MSERYNYIGAICQVSGNPCGTDTHAKGFPCQCAPCRAIDCIAELETKVAMLEKKNADLNVELNNALGWYEKWQKIASDRSKEILRLMEL